MQNNKVLKQRAKLYDDLLTCSYGDGNKFSDGNDLARHITEVHHQTLTATQWWNKFKRALFDQKDDLWVSDAKNGVNQFSFGELADAFKKVRQSNIHTKQESTDD